MIGKELDAMLCRAVKIINKKDPSFKVRLGKFLKKSSWYVCSCDEENKCSGEGCDYKFSESFVIPCKPRRLLKPGDVIMFSDSSTNSDRFLEISAEDIREWKAGKRDLLPVGIVFRPKLVKANFHLLA
ncbi:MAG: hypothetical protein PHP03_03495 [Candidatus Pacebacteria bacterium]|nr:hypothetical protein [Candidatus Paceibacterota bacterium]